MRLIAGLATLLSVLCLATGASAHATLVSTVPADGSVAGAGAEVSSTALQRGGDAGGRQRDRCRRHRRATMRRYASPAIPSSSRCRTTCRAGPMSSATASPRKTATRSAGSMVFSIGAVTGSAANPAKAGSVNGLIWLARIGVYLGLFVGVGGAFFRMLDRPRARGFAADHRRPGGGPGQRRGGARASGPRLAGSAARQRPDGGAVEGRRGNELVSVPADRGGGDDRRDHGAAKQGRGYRRIAVGARAVRRRPVARLERACRDGRAAMADPRRWCSCMAWASPSGSARSRRWRRWHGDRRSRCFRS